MDDGSSFLTNELKINFYWGFKHPAVSIVLCEIISTETIEMAANDYLGDREGMELELFLEGLFRTGKLVKIHGGDSTGWGPSPAWLSSSF